MKILNLTQHPGSPEQVEAGVFEPVFKEQVKELLTFTELPDYATIVNRAESLANLADVELFKEEEKYAMIGGAPYLMSLLEDKLAKKNIRYLYAFSKRASIETDGIKTSIVKHVGFIGTTY